MSVPIMRCPARIDRLVFDLTLWHGILHLQSYAKRKLNGGRREADTPSPSRPQLSYPGELSHTHTGVSNTGGSPPSTWRNREEGWEGEIGVRAAVVITGLGPANIKAPVLCPSPPMAHSIATLAHGTSVSRISALGWLAAMAAAHCGDGAVVPWVSSRVARQHPAD